MTVSVLIPTYRRKHYLLHTLACLEKQTIKPDEIIIIDASEDMYALDQDDLTVFLNNIQYVRWSEIGNVSKQRNAAIKLAQKDLILFLDDDVSFGPNLILNHLEVYRIHRLDALSGVIETPDQPFGSRPILNHSTLSNPHGPNLQATNLIEQTHVICTANFSVLREVVLKMKGFDENIFGSLDDVEFGVRLFKKGFMCIHHPSPKVYHFLAKSSGARSPKLGEAWGTSNLFYFQMKHYYSRSIKKILFLALLPYLRPSRLWFNPLRFFKRVAVIFHAYNWAKIRILEGEKLMN